MKILTILAFLGVATLASANPQISSPTGNATSTISESISPTANCVTRCSAADFCCQAACAGVPCPNSSMANSTTDCEMRCPQGNGTQAETDAYAKCQQGCISSFYFSGSGGVVTATGSQTVSAFVGNVLTTTGSASSATSSSDSTISGSSGSKSGSSGSSTTTGALASSTGKSAAGHIETWTSAFGLVCVILAMFGL